MEGFLRAIRAIGIFAFFFCYSFTAAYAATEYLPETHIFISADVNADQREDAIAQPRRRDSEAAVLLGFGEDDPEMLWQRLEDIDPELAWDDEHAALLAADFNGDGRDDLYLQGRSIGSVQAILLANEEGRFTGAQQKFSGPAMGIDWAADLRQAIAGDFDGNGRSELLLQGRLADDVHLVITPNADGTLNNTGPSWIDGHLDLRWNAGNIELYAGDFNGDGHTDLLWRRNAHSPAREDEPAVALLLASPDGTFDDIAQQWEKDFLDAEWDPATHDIRIADINGDGIADIILHARDGGMHYLLTGGIDGRFSEVALRWQGDETAEQAWAARQGGSSSIEIEYGDSNTAGSTSKEDSAAPTQQKSVSEPGTGEVGTLPGEFSVDPTGAANYRIPISVPGGVGGMQPDLAFMYSSRAGNGLLGQGWSLSGLSAITRCPQSIAQTGNAYNPVTFSNTDAFCLDGQLLKQAEGTGNYGDGGVIYGTEISSFQRVESFEGDNGTGSSYTGPDYFTVKDKAGLIREYGKTSDSRIKLAGKNVRKQWSVNRISDRYGNYIRFEYEQGSQGTMRAYWPKRISWHNNNDVLIGKVEFSYDDRPDITKGSEPFAQDPDIHGNSLFNRLATVKVYARDTAVREYRIAYTQLVPSGLSAIDNIQQCDPRGSCLPATQFNWSGGQVNFKQNARELRWLHSDDPIAFKYLRLGDVNGDGRVDALADTSGGGELYWVDLAVGKADKTGLEIRGDYKESLAITLDYDRDGRDELLMASNPEDIPECTGEEGEGECYEPVECDESDDSEESDPECDESDANSSIPGTWHIVDFVEESGFSILDTGRDAFGYNRNPAPLDINNDGFPEILFFNEGQIHFYRNGPNGFEDEFTTIEGSVVAEDADKALKHRIIPVEFNGDGLTDILVLEAKSTDGVNSRIYISDGDTLIPGPHFNSEKVIPIDWNGDGLTDLFAMGGPLGTDPDKWHSFMNVGGEYVFGRTHPWSDDDLKSYKKAKVVDWNRDGRPDLLRPGDSVWKVDYYDPARNDNKWFTEGTELEVDNENRFFPLEYDGNGITDILYKDGTVWKARPGAGEMPGLLIHARNGLGDEQQISYWNQNRFPPRSSIYVGHEPESTDTADYDFFDMDTATETLLQTGDARYFMASMPLVSSIETGTGVRKGGMQGRIVTSYRYGGAVMDVTGRGFLGFRMMRVVNSNTGIETINMHRQAWPYTGMIEKAMQKMDDTEIVTDSRPEGAVYCNDYDDEQNCGFESRDITYSSGKLVSESTSAFDKIEDAVDGGIFPYVIETTEESYRFASVDDVPPTDRIVTTTYTYSDTGDPTKIVVKTTDGAGSDKHLVTTDNLYEQNDPGKDWCLGRLTSSSVLHKRANHLPDNKAATEATREASFTYDETKLSTDLKSCRLQSETSNEDSDAELTKSYTPDSFGNTRVTTVRDAEGNERTTTREYDQYGLFPVATINSFGHRESHVWDHRFGVKRSSTGPNGLTTRWEYDDFGRLLHKSTPRKDVYSDHVYKWCKTEEEGGTEEENCVSDSAVYFTKVSSSAGPDAYSVTEYDSLGRKVATRSPNFNGDEIVNETVYDSLGRAYLVSLPYVKGDTAKCWKHTIFDMLGRPEVTSQPANPDQCIGITDIDESRDTAAYPNGLETNYTYEGPVTTVEDQDDRKKVTVSNVMGRTLTVIEGVGDISDISDPVTEFDYDVFGNTTTVIPPDGGTVHIGYDAAGNKTSMTDPDMGTWTYDYNGFGELKTQIDAEGNVVKMDYDALGRMITRRDIPSGESAQETHWLYDIAYGAGVGKLAYVQSPDGYAEGYAYNEYGQATDTARLIDDNVYWTSQTYDDQGRPDILVYPDVDTFDASGTPDDTVTIDAPGSSTGTHTVSWTKAGEVATYTLYRSKDSTARSDAERIYTGPLTAFTDRVNEDGDYRYWVRSFHDAACATAAPGETIAECPVAGPATTAVTVPPQSPAYLDVQAYSKDSEGVALEWGSALAADDYRIERATAFDGEYVSVSSSEVGTSTVVNGLADGSYYFRVSACKDSVCSKPTPGVNAAIVVSKPPQAATPVLDTAEVSNGLFITVDGTVSLTWASSSDSAVNAHEVDILQLDDNGITTLLRTELSSDYSHDFTGLAHGRYRFRVRDCKADNAERYCSDTSAASDILHVGQRPSIVPSLDSPATTSGSITLSFENPEYRRWHEIEIDEATDPDFTQNLRRLDMTPDPCYDDEGMEVPCEPPTQVNVQPGSVNGPHWYRIRMCNSHYGGIFGCSEQWTVTSHATDVQRAPTVPTDLSAPAGSSTGNYSVSWEASIRLVDRYELFEATQSDFSDETLIHDTGTATSVDISDKTDGKWFYRVRACYQTWCSTFGDTASTNVLLPPSAPAVFDIEPSSSNNGDYLLQWSDADGEVTDYVLEESASADFADTTVIPENIGCDAYEDGSCVKPVSENHADVTGRSDGTYYYRVKACNNNGCSDWTEGSSPMTVLHPPGVPASLTVPSESSGTHTLNWSSGSGQVDDYELFEADNSEYDNETMVATVTGSSKPLSRANGVYYYRIRACNDSGCSDFRNGSNAVAVTNPPGVPGVMSIPSDSSNGNYTVSWSEASGSIESYELQESASSDFSSTTDINVPSSCVEWYQDPDPDAPAYCVDWAPDTSVDISGRDDGDYHYRVRACNASTCSDWRVGGNAVAVLHPPGVPGSISVPTSSDGGHDVSWTAASGQADTYELHEATTADFATPTVYETSGLSESLSGKPDGEHYYRVRACNDSGCSGWRTGANATDVLNKPGTPSSISVPTDSNGSHIVNWGSASGQVAYYRLYEATSSDFSNQVKVYEGLNLSETLSGKPDGEHYYRVHACNDSGCSSWRTGANAADVLNKPGVPESLTVPSESSGNHTISWNSGSGQVANYELYEADNSSFSGQTLVFDSTGSSKPLNRADGVYYYRIRACNDSGCSDFRNGSNAVAVTNPPGAPGVMSIPSDSTSGNYTVSWGAASGSIESYELQESASSDFSSTSDINVPSSCVEWYQDPDPSAPAYCVDWAPDTSVDISGRDDGDYHYRVRACNASACSDWRVGGNAVAVLHPPGVPGSISVPESSNGSLTVSWTAASGQVASYKLYESTSSNFSSQTQVYSGTNLSKALSGRSDGEHYYRVRACNASGCSSYRTGANAADVLNKPGTPSSISVPTSSTGSHTVSWGSASGQVERYELYEADNGSFSNATRVYNNTGTSRSLSGRSDGEYYYRVRACNASGCSGWRSGANATDVLNKPGAPSSISVPSSSTGDHTVSWGSASGQVDSYRLYESTSSNFSGQTRVYNGSNLSTSLSRSDGTYYYRVLACNASGCSSWRTGTNSTSVLNKPGTPSSISVPTSSTGSHTVNWGSASGQVDRYQLYEADNGSFSNASRVYNSSGTSRSLSGRNDGTYYYRVRACNDSGCSGWRTGSNSTSVLNKPSTPSSISVPSESDGSHTVSWGSASGQVDSYQLYEADNSSFSGQTVVFNSTGSSKPMNRADGVYYYRVRACNDSGCSGWRTGGNPVAVTNLPGSPGSMSIPSLSSNGNYNVSWNDASGSVENYELQESTSSSFSNASNINVPSSCVQWYQDPDPSAPAFCVDWAPDTSVSFSGQGNGTYYYRVRACNDTGCSGWRTGGNAIKVELPPSTPGSISVPTNSNGSHTVSWGSASGQVTAYKLYEATSSNFSGQTLVYSGTSLSKALGGRSDGTYYYRVRACNGGSCSSYRSGSNSTSVLNKPSTPSSISVPSSSTGNHTVSWGSASGQVASYKLYESTSSNFSGQSLVYNGTNLSKALSKSDGTYYYRVRACNASGCSSYRTGSNSTSVLNKPGTPSSISVPTSSTGSHTVNWGSASGQVDRYQLYEADNGSFSNASRVYNSSGTSRSLSGRSDGTYYYRVRACNDSGCSGWRTGSNSTSVLNKPSTPSSISVPSSSVGSHTVSWGSASGQVDRYQLYEADNGSFSNASRVYNSSGTSKSLHGRSDGDYYYRVRACNDSGCSGWRTGSNSTSVLNKPSTPTSISVPSSSAGSHTISWASSSGQVASYKLYESSTYNFSSQTLVYSGTNTSKALSGRSNGTYYYRVRACNASGCSSYRAGSNPTDVLNKPGTPSSISVPSSSYGNHTISWGSASGQVASYKLYEATSSNFSGQSLVYSGTNLSKALSDRANGNYYYRVRACNSSGCSGYRSGGNAVNVNRTPGVPSSISVPISDDDGYYGVNWGSASGNVTAYKLYESTSSDFSNQYLVYSGTSTYASLSNSNGTYYYRVRACNDGDCSGYRTGDNGINVYIASCDPRFGCGGQIQSLDDGSVTDGDSDSGSETDGTDDGGNGGNNNDNGNGNGNGNNGNGNGNGGPTSGDATPATTTLDAILEDAEGFVANDSRNGNGSHSARVVKTGNNSRHDDKRDGFRLMPPPRPGEAYAQLRVGKPANDTAGRAIRTSSRAKARNTSGASDTGSSAGAGVRKLHQVLGQRMSGRAGALSRPHPDSAQRDGNAIEKFGVTNEPQGSYAHAVKRIYDPATGALHKVRECVPNSSDTECDESKGQVYWTAEAVNVLGAVTHVTLGNGLETVRSYNTARGLVTNITTSGSHGTVQEQTFTWNLAGNLEHRHDKRIHDQGGIEQDFTYDAMGRLTDTTTDYKVSYLNEDTRHNRYKANGNIACFNVADGSGCGTTSPDYSYHTSKPHAVEQVAGKSGSYTYTLNGAMKTGPNDRNIEWTSFNKPARIDGKNSEGADVYAAFAYDANRSRYRMTTGKGDGTVTTTTYVGALYERVETGGNTTHRFHIFAGGEAVAVYSCTTDCGKDPDTGEIGDTKAETRYFHKDHLGSITAITRGKPDAENKLLVERFHYSAWGEQMAWIEDDGSTTTGGLAGATSAEQDRGFTGHVMLAELNLIHMNGRVYDPTIGRFLSADPFVQFPNSTQGYNRYSYLGNNPLNATDPSGYFSFKDAIKVGAGLVAMSVLGPVAGGAVAGYLSTGDMKGALLGGIAGFAAAYIGASYQGLSAAQGGYLTSPQVFEKAMTHGLAQGALSTAGGGRFGDGFLGGFSSSLLGPYLDAAGPVGGTMIAAAVGGTAAKLGGGKFANGALSGAFVHAFNELLHGGMQTDESGVEAHAISESGGGEKRVTLVCREVSGGFDHCGTFVHTGANVDNAKIEAQFSLGYGETEFYPQGSDAGTYQTDLDAFRNPNGEGVSHHGISTPQGESANSFADKVIKYGSEYQSTNGYQTFSGPNSNSAASWPILKAGGSIPIPVKATPALFYYQDRGVGQ